MKLFKLLNTFSLDLTEEFFSLNDASALNIEVLSAEKIAYSLIAKKKKWELVCKSIKISGLLTTFQSAIRLDTGFKTA